MPLVEPLLIEPPVEVDVPTEPGAAIVPLFAPLLIDPDVSLVDELPMVLVGIVVLEELLPLLILPGVPCLADPIGSLALTPLLVVVLVSVDCARAKLDEASMVHRTVDKNKRDILFSPVKLALNYLPEPPPPGDMPLPIEPVLEPVMPLPVLLLAVDVVDEFFIGGLMALPFVVFVEPLTSFFAEPFMLDRAEGEVAVVVPPIIAEFDCANAPAEMNRLPARAAVYKYGLT